MLKSDPILNNVFKLYVESHKNGDFDILETEVLNKNDDIQTESVGTDIRTFSVDGQEAFVTLEHFQTLH